MKIIVLDEQVLKEKRKLINLTKLRSELWEEIVKYATSIGFEDSEVSDYFFLEITDDKTMKDLSDEGKTNNDINIEVRAELDFDGMMDLIDKLNPIVKKYDDDSYFDMYDSGIAQCLMLQESLSEAYTPGTAKAQDLRALRLDSDTLWINLRDLINEYDFGEENNKYLETAMKMTKELSNKLYEMEEKEEYED